LSILICGKFQDYSGESTVNSKVKGARNEVHLAAWAQGADVTDGGYDALSIVDNAAGLFCRATELVGIISPFARLISHQPAVLFSQNEPATSNQPQPASSTLLSEQTSASHQPPANRTGCIFCVMITFVFLQWATRCCSSPSNNPPGVNCRPAMRLLLGLHVRADGLLARLWLL
jgi:hypothetical protein